MSSTNRGAVRNAQDFYATPESAFKPLLPRLPMNCRFWEPARGDGRLVRWLCESGRNATGNDLDSGYDFLKDQTVRDVIITNPPFSLAHEFCDHALDRGNTVVMLLRLNFLGSQKRYAWWKFHEPDALYVLSKRPDFTGGGGDSCEYAWFCWGQHFVGAGIQHLPPHVPALTVDE